MVKNLFEKLKLDFSYLIFLLFAFIYLNDQIPYFLAHDEIPPYYGSATHFFKAQSLKTYFHLLTHSQNTFGHPFLFPFLYGSLMKVFGEGSHQAKVFIIICSSFSMYYFNLIARKLLYPRVGLILLSFGLLVFSPVFYVNFALFLGDTFLLPFCLAFLYFYLNQQFKKMLFIGLLAGLARQSFLLFLSGIILYDLITYQPEKRKMIIYLIGSSLSSLMWFGLNKIIYGKFIHTFSNINLDKPELSGIRFNLDFWSLNIKNHLIALKIQDMYLVYCCVLFFLGLFLIKKLNPIHKKFYLITLSVLFTTFIPLGFFHGFYLRYLLYGYILIFINIVILSQYIRNKKIIASLLIFLLSTPLFHELKYSDDYYGKNAMKKYKLSMRFMKKHLKTRDENLLYYICFPYKNMLCNYKGVYPENPMRDKFKCINWEGHFRRIEKFYFICPKRFDPFLYEYIKYVKDEKQSLVHWSPLKEIDYLQVIKVEKRTSKMPK